MKTIAKRLRRLEDQFGSADGTPWRHFRLVVTRADRTPSLANATCCRRLCPGGVVMEIVDLTNSLDGFADAGGAGHDEDDAPLTAAQLEAFVQRFPIESSNLDSQSPHFRRTE